MSKQPDPFNECAKGYLSIWCEGFPPADLAQFWRVLSIMRSGELTVPLHVFNFVFSLATEDSKDTPAVRAVSDKWCELFEAVRAWSIERQNARN